MFNMFACSTEKNPRPFQRIDRAIPLAGAISSVIHFYSNLILNILEKRCSETTCLVFSVFESGGQSQVMMMMMMTKSFPT